MAVDDSGGRRGWVTKVPRSGACGKAGRVLRQRDGWHMHADSHRRGSDD
jgi:hypothetical protein